MPGQPPMGTPIAPDSHALGQQSIDMVSRIARMRIASFISAVKRNEDYPYFAVIRK